MSGGASVESFDASNSGELFTQRGCPPLCNIRTGAPAAATRSACCCSVGPRSGGPIGNYVWLCGCGRNAPGRGGVGFPLCTNVIVGPDWPCHVFTVCLIVVPTAVHWGFVVRPMVQVNLVNVPVGALALITGSLLLACYLAVAWADPGIIPRREFPPLERPSNTSLCSKCHVYRPRKATHCTTCGVCVLHLDHHCPWTGKCIGQRNLCFFYAFLTTMGLHLVSSGATAVYYIVMVVIPGKMTTPV